MLGNNAAPLQAVAAIIEEGAETAHGPAGRVTEGQRQQGVADKIRHHEHIALAEEHEGEEHDIHRDAAVARPTQSARENVVDAEKEVEGR